MGEHQKKSRKAVCLAFLTPPTAEHRGRLWSNKLQMLLSIVKAAQPLEILHTTRQVIKEYRSAFLKVVTLFEAHTLIFSYFVLSSRLGVYFRVTTSFRSRFNSFLLSWGSGKKLKKQKPTAKPQLTYKDKIKCCKHTHIRSLFFSAISCWQQTHKPRQHPWLFHTHLTQGHTTANTQGPLSYTAGHSEFSASQKLMWCFFLLNGNLCSPLEKEAKYWIRYR